MRPARESAALRFSASLGLFLTGMSACHSKLAALKDTLISRLTNRLVFGLIRDSLSMVKGHVFKPLPMSGRAQMASLMTLV